MNIEQKAEIAKRLEGQFAESAASFFVTYQGSDSQSLVDFRRKLGDCGASFSVVKNTIAKRSLPKEQLDALDGVLQGPTAVVFSGGDPAASAKVVANYAKDNEFITVKAGILDGAVISSNEVDQLSKLPSREELLAKLLSLFNAPATKLLQTINEPGAQLVRTIEAVRRKMEEGQQS